MGSIIKETLPKIIIGKDISTVVIIIVTFIIIICFWIFILKNLSLDSLSAETLVFFCQECATNLTTGQKRCPKDIKTGIYIDPSNEVCNPKFSCSNKLTPFAVNYDGSTNSNGACAPGIACDCVKQQQSPFYAATKFIKSSGKVQQFSTDSKTENNFTWTLNPNNLSYLANSSCKFDKFILSNVYLAAQTTLTCVKSNPCAYGTMVYYPANPLGLVKDGFNNNTIKKTPLICANYNVPTCSETQVPFLDIRYATVSCANGPLPP